MESLCGWLAGPRTFFARTLLLIASAMFIFVASCAAQLVNCTSTAASVTSARADGLTEPIGNITVSCAGGTAGATASITAFLGLNTNVTNRLDMNGMPIGIVVTVNTGVGAVPVGSVTINGATVFINGLAYTIPAAPASPVLISITGLRAAIGTVAAGTTPGTVTATVNGVGAVFSGPSLTLAVAAPTLLSSVFNSGIPCGGSPLPPTLDFPGFSGQNSATSTVRVTEASPNGFTPRGLGDDSGLRIIVKLSGYSSGDRVFVPDAVVGSDGTTPTSSGYPASTVNAGTYTPGLKQLLLLRVNGADANGVGGNLVFAVPSSVVTFSTFGEIGLASGAGYAVYETADSNPNLPESAQIPAYLVAPQIACTGTTVVPTISASIAPVSTVAVATVTDPIPRFNQTVAGSDCTQLGDCGASYFPNFTVDTTPIGLMGASLGSKQAASFGVSNTGGGIVGFTASIVYSAAASGWLAVTPSSGQNSATLQVQADPSMLQPGVYSATVTVSAPGFAPAGVPVTFTVGPPGVTISNVLNAASGVSPVAPGSYTAIYGLNLGGQIVTVTFSGLQASVIYDSATQINVIVPAALGAAAAADVVVRADGKTSNSFKINLAPNQPGIFNPGIENADGSINSASSPARRGSFVAVYLTGLAVPLTGQVTVNIGGQSNLIPLYAGAQPTLPALDQVNVTIPATLPALPNFVPLTICIPGPSGQAVCSNAASLYIQ